MSWKITSTALLVDDPDAMTYLAAVEAADGQVLESSVRLAVNAFIKGCKNDGIWPAIKASCILAGARTLNGALVPLVGPAPTNFNFVSGDYNRKTGLIGDGATKYLASNRDNNADLQNNKHVALWVSSLATTSPNPVYFGGDGVGGSTQILDVGSLSYRINSLFGESSGAPFATGFAGVARSASANSVNRNNGITRTSNTASSPPTNENSLIYRRSNLSGVSYANARLAFYSIGESLDLALLDTRVTTLINQFAAAIP